LVLHFGSGAEALGFSRKECSTARNERSASAEIGVRHEPKSLFDSLRNQRSLSPEMHTQQCRILYRSRL